MDYSMEKSIGLQYTIISLVYFKVARCSTRTTTAPFYVSHATARRLANESGHHKAINFEPILIHTFNYKRYTYIILSCTFI